jgi:hypothetical protein
MLVGPIERGQVVDGAGEAELLASSLYVWERENLGELNVPIRG